MSQDRGALRGEGDPSPIRISGREPAVLAFHGFGATPVEMKLVVEVAAALGLEAYAPLLPGHGTHASELAKSTFADWMRGADAALDSVLGASKKAIVVGLSLGSLVAAHLAVTRKNDVCALGMLANATRLGSPFPTVALKLVERLRIPDFSVPKGPADIGDPAMRATQLTYGTQPIHAAIEVLRAGERVEKELGAIDAPAFIAHGRYDLVCPVANAARVAGLLGSREKHVEILPRSHHIVTRDYDRETLRLTLTDFIARHAEKRPLT
jgi:carboxylesterase